MIINAIIASILFFLSWLYVSSRRDTKESLDERSVRRVHKETLEQTETPKEAPGPVLQNKGLQDTRKIARDSGDHGASSPSFGATREEREELAEELKELSPAERKALLASWEAIPEEELKSSTDPTAEDLEKQLKEHRQEMAALMHKAAYDKLDGKAEAALVKRMRELKQIVELEAELLQMTVAENAVHLKAAPDTGGKNGPSLMCQPCAK
jgi:hypothetical protein